MPLTEMMETSRGIALLRRECGQSGKCRLAMSRECRAFFADPCARRRPRSEFAEDPPAGAARTRGSGRPSSHDSRPKPFEIA